jgi:hypothetical protein
MEIPTYDELFKCKDVVNNKIINDPELSKKWKKDIQLACRKHNRLSPPIIINIGDRVKINPDFGFSLSILSIASNHIVPDFVRFLLTDNSFKVINIKYWIVTVKAYNRFTNECHGDNYFIPIDILSQVILIKSDYKITKAAIKSN